MKREAFGSSEPGAPASAGTIEDRTIGRILVDLGKLKAKDVARVFALHRKKGLRFGEAARRLRLVDEDDIRTALAIQFDYPYLKPGQGMLGPELITAYDPFHAQSEALRDLRTHLVTQWASGERRVLAVVSPAPQDGRSYLAANLAVAFAQLGEETLLIDADLRCPRQHRVFGLNGGVGLAQALSGRGGVGIAERIAYFHNLGVIGAGAAPPNPLELLSREGLPRLLGAARREYTIVILDTSAAARGADAKVVASRADGVLMVARQDCTKLAELERLRQAVVTSGVPVVGTVLNRA